VSRAQVPKEVIDSVLMRSGRRCCLCHGLFGDGDLKQGQIAHLDHNSANCNEDNLAFFCLEHHDWYDSKTSQSKGLTIGEVKNYRKQLYGDIASLRESARHNLTAADLKVAGHQKASSAGSRLPDFHKRMKLIASLSLRSDRDARYETMVEVALAHGDTDLALNAVDRLSLRSGRDRWNWVVFNHLLAINEPDTARALIPRFSLRTDKDQALQRLLGT